MECHLFLSKGILTLNKWVVLCLKGCPGPGLIVVNTGARFPASSLAPGHASILAANRVSTLDFLAQITALLPF